MSTMVTRETFHHEYFDSVLIFLLNTVVIHFVKKCHSQEATLDVNPVHSSFYEGADEYRQNFNSSTQEILLNTSVHSEISTSSGISIQTVQSHFRNSENETESIAPSFISEQESAAIGSEHRATPYIPTPVDKFQHLNVLVSSIPNTVVIPDVLMSQTATTQTAMSTTLQTEIHELKSSDNFKTVPWLIHDSLSRIDVITSPVTKLQKSSQPTKMTDLSTQTNVTPSILSSEEAIRDETDSQVFNSFQPDTTFVISSHHSTTVSSQLTSITLKVTNENTTTVTTSEQFNSSHRILYICLAFAIVGLIATTVILVYYLRQRGSKRKVYLSHHGMQPKDFVDNTRVCSPVLLPEEIEMQSEQPTNLRVQRAVILPTDATMTEINLESTTTNQNFTDWQSGNTTCPPPPPYRLPPPYLPDTVIQNVHAL